MEEAAHKNGDYSNGGSSSHHKHPGHGHSMHLPAKADFKKLVSSVFSRIQGTDAFRKMKLRHNTDANIKLVKDLKHAVYLKPEHKLNEHHQHHQHHDHHPEVHSRSSGEGDSVRSEGSTKRVHFEEFVEEICFKGSVLGEHMQEAVHARDSVLDILGVDVKAPAVKQAFGKEGCDDQVLAAVLNSVMQKSQEQKLAQEALGKGDQNGAVRTFIRMESTGDESEALTRNKMLRTKSLRSDNPADGLIVGGQVAPQIGGHGSQACSLVINEDFTAKHGEVSMTPITMPTVNSSQDFALLKRSYSLPVSKLSKSPTKGHSPTKSSSPSMSNAMSSSIDSVDVEEAAKPGVEHISSFSLSALFSSSAKSALPSTPPRDVKNLPNHWDGSKHLNNHEADDKHLDHHEADDKWTSRDLFRRTASDGILRTASAPDIKGMHEGIKASGTSDVAANPEPQAQAQTVDSEEFTLRKSKSTPSFDEITQLQLIQAAAMEIDEFDATSSEGSDTLMGVGATSTRLASPTLSFDGENIIRKTLELTSPAMASAASVSASPPLMAAAKLQSLVESAAAASGFPWLPPSRLPPLSVSSAVANEYPSLPLATLFEGNDLKLVHPSPYAKSAPSSSPHASLSSQAVFSSGSANKATKASSPERTASNCPQHEEDGGSRGGMASSNTPDSPPWNPPVAKQHEETSKSALLTPLTGSLPRACAPPGTDFGVGGVVVLDKQVDVHRRDHAELSFEEGMVAGEKEHEATMSNSVRGVKVSREESADDEADTWH